MIDLRYFEKDLILKEAVDVQITYLYIIEESINIRHFRHCCLHSKVPKSLFANYSSAYTLRGFVAPLCRAVCQYHPVKKKSSSVLVSINY